jgi:adenine specific DNA methylase Mod
LVKNISIIKVYNALALPILLYGSEIWTLRRKNKKQLTSIDMKYCIRTAGYRFLDHKRNEEILEELKLEQVEEKPRRYKSNWLQHVTSMSNRMSKIMLNYRQNGQR